MSNKSKIKNPNAKKQVKKTSKKSSKDKKVMNINRMSVFTIVLMLIIIVMFLGVYFGIRWAVMTLKYKEYTNKMNDYGYNLLYNNGKASASQSVKNEELLKVIIGSIKNETDISRLYSGQSENDENTNWFEYAKSLGLEFNVNSSNLNEKAAKIDAVICAVEAVENLLNVEIGESELKISKGKLSKYTTDEQTIISKAVTLGLIKNSNSGLSTKKLNKGELNKIIITLVEKYATVYYKTIAVDNDGNLVKQNINLVTEDKNKPQNYEEYPYIVDNIEKGIYELGYNVTLQSRFKNPKEVYSEVGYLYNQIDEIITRYFNVILNVDYNTITTDNFLNAIKTEVVYTLHEEDVKDYVNYVKKNKIKLEGKATPLLPIIYDNGEQYVVRTKIEFKVINSETSVNLLYADDFVEYSSKDIVMYVDLLMGNTLNSNSLRVYISPLVDSLAIENSNVKVVK